MAQEAVFERPRNFDPRPGREHDKAWFARCSAESEANGKSTSAQLLDAVGLREEYETLRTETARRKAALELLLRCRNSVPGADAIHLKPWEDDTDRLSPKTVHPNASNPNNWDKREYCPIVDRDMPEVCEALWNFRQLEGITVARLNDEEASTIWHISGAGRKFLSGAGVAPKKVLVESPWLGFGEYGRIAFRFFPGGDATAIRGYSTIFAFMSKPPGLCFTFVMRIGESLSTAPRLWLASKTNYRMDVPWAQVQQEIVKASQAGDKLVITLFVIQWHGPEDADAPKDIQAEDRWSCSTAVDVIDGCADHEAYRRTSVRPT